MTIKTESLMIVLMSLVVAVMLIMGIANGYIPFGPPPVIAQSQNPCKIYHDKAKELAEKGAEDLPERQTLNFDPRIAKSKASLAYSQIYRNCKEYGE